jgi:hypothetical protein
LKRLSAQLKPTAQEAQTTLNAAIVFFYGEQTNKPANDFQTLESWNNKGYKIKKGEKGFPIWDKPVTMNIEKTNDEGDILPENLEEITFFPMVYLFHFGQVERKTAK